MTSRHMNSIFFPAAIRPIILKTFCFCDHFSSSSGWLQVFFHIPMILNFRFQTSLREVHNNPSSTTMRLSIHFDWYVRLEVKYYLLEAL